MDQTVRFRDFAGALAALRSRRTASGCVPSYSVLSWLGRRRFGAWRFESASLRGGVMTARFRDSTGRLTVRNRDDRPGFSLSVRGQHRDFDLHVNSAATDPVRVEVCREGRLTVERPPMRPKEFIRRFLGA
ncbi:MULTISPECIES: hypothetical protein [unclassified Nitrobacter]|uniref:hypothetical protein n=1 Tax=unclassified Nitrobacter TaxID=2620411 RepID=UPI0009287E53|nr:MULTISPECIES: hypothetical protein [unclassified Nitrobacter]MBN9149164.1 hypothetical protein [Nitrobacter sp.]OJV00594.1 MAG: hypothetical protein BGO16_10995 [Nitrobacter sp. 62-23]